MTDREFINWLAFNLAERRSDISDMCTNFLENGTEPKIEDIESRYIQATIPGTEIEIEYDTLRTIFEYHKPLQQWERIDDCTYRND